MSHASPIDPSDDFWTGSDPGVPIDQPVDLFQNQPVPAFPLEALPEPLRAFAIEYSAQSGFDVGAYGFGLLVDASNIIDHRARLRITDTWSAPPFQWGAMIDPSGGGKSPVMDACGQCSQPVYDEITEESSDDLAQWHRECEKLGRSDPQPAKPEWRQRHTENTTVEGLAGLAATTPEGVNMRVDEMSEWVGRMDAYHKGSGAQDRANFLKAYNGSPTTITRANKNTLIKNWSVGLLAGVQPEKLANLFKRSGDASDGLFQRVLLYVFQPAREADFTARLGPHTRNNAINLFRRLAYRDGLKIRPAFDHTAMMAMQSYVNETRRLAERTPSRRLREHINKFPGFVARLTLALHCIDAASADHDPGPQVTIATFERARRIMAVLYRHSEAVYATIDGQAQETMSLARSAAEAILSKGWRTFNRGDLTRHATNWRHSDHLTTESAVDLLIELGWLIDITEPSPAGKRGRRSAGKFEVPEMAHVYYRPQADRIRKDREERKQAIEVVAASRRELIE
jgi:hypothetical protein